MRYIPRLVKERILKYIFSTAIENIRVREALLVFNFRRGAMKRTDKLRRERELKRAQKKEDRIQKSASGRQELTIGDYINNLYSLFFHDAEKIYNINQSEEILELLEDMKDNIPEEKWDTVLRKAVKKAQIKSREEAVKQLLSLLTSS